MIWALFNGVKLDRFASTEFAVSRGSVDITCVADFSTCNPGTGCVFCVVVALSESTIIDDNSVLLQDNKAVSPIIKEQQSNISLKWLRQFSNGLCQGVKAFTNSIMYIIWRGTCGVIVGSAPSLSLSLYLQLKYNGRYR